MNKRYFSRICFLSCLLLSLWGCQDVNDFGSQYSPALDAHFLSLNTSEIFFASPSGSKATLDVSSVSTPWEFNGLAGWLSASALQGSADQTVTFTAEGNLSGEKARTSVFRFASTTSDYAFSRNVTATQKAADPYLYVNDVATANITFNAKAETKTVRIDANVEWKVSVPTNPDWLIITVSEDSTVITLSASDNTTTKERGATITLSNSDVNVIATINVTQAMASTPVPSEYSISFGNTGGAYSISINSEFGWTATTSASWLELSQAEGAEGVASFTVEAAPNTSNSSRSAFIYISIGGNHVLSIPVSQDGIYLRIGRSSINLASDVSSDTTAVKANTSWTAVSSDSWLTVTPSSGSNDGTLHFEATENNGSASRTATVTVDGGSLLGQVKITQPGKSFSISPTTATVEMPASGGSHTIQLSTNDSWTASSTSSWMKLSSMSGKGDATVVMTTPSFTSVKARRDTTTFTPAHLNPVKIITLQAARFLKVDISSLSFFSKGGTSNTITVSTDAEYTITPSDSWLTVARSGKTFTVTAEENKSETERTAKVLVAMSGLPSGESEKIEITVSQRGAGSGVGLMPFTDFHLWDIEIGGDATISITDFTDEQRWD